MIRLVLVALLLVPLTAWHALRILWAVLLNRPDAQVVSERGPRTWARVLLRSSRVDVVFENDGVLDRERAQILVANHVSWYDVLALIAHIPGRVVFVAKKELERVPLFGRAAGAAGHVFVDRHDRAQAVESLESARKTLEEAHPTVIMFAEGTRSADGELKPFKKGAMVLAIQTGTEIVPAAISGSFEVLAKRSWRLRPGTIRVRFGEPIPVAGYGIEDRNELTQTVWERVKALQTAR